MEGFRISLLVLFLIHAWVPFSSAEDAITFTSVPDSITFNTIEAIHSSKVADIFSSMLSYTLAKPFSWQSLGAVNPLKRPEAIFVLDLMGVSPDLQLNIQGTKFPLENLNDLDDQYTVLALRTNERFRQSTNGKPILVKMNADDELYGPKSEHQVLFKSIPADSEGRLEKAKEDPDLGRTLQEGTFNTSFLPDSMLLVELETVKLLHKALVLNKAVIRDNVPDIFLVQLKALHGIVEEYGTDSNQAKEAVRLLEQTCMESVTTLRNVYDNEAVVAVITETAMPYMLARKSRSLLQSKPGNEIQVVLETNDILFMSNFTAFEFSDDFHVAFALIFFTSILLILTVLGVSVAMWFMDPGRDSIIYRMTSQRKKD